MANFRCPYCERDQYVTDPKSHSPTVQFSLVENAEGTIGARFTAVSCANPDCRRTTIRLRLTRMGKDVNGRSVFDPRIPPFFFEQIMPRSTGRVYPEYIPKVLLEDYHEAWLIKDLSPKAAATLVRRCLQGMIRDFCNIKKGTLNEEIKALRALIEKSEAPQGVSIQTVDAIDQVRGIGNIGAHMEKDIDLIVPVEPGEVDLLLGLVEMLFDEWYIARHRRDERLTAIAAMAEEKEALRKGVPPKGALEVDDNA